MPDEILQVGPSVSARALLAKYGLAPKKAWGQNFLTDLNAQLRIAKAADLGPDDVVVEIGAGLGALTTHLAKTARRVFAVERDPDLVNVLRAELVPKHEGLFVESGDALAVDFAAKARDAQGPLVVIGNLPYQITSPLIFRVIDASDGGRVVTRAVFMVQREFAERMVAAPGSKIYGRLSVMVQQSASVRILFHVNPGAFFPPPKVTSTVFRMDLRAAPLAPVRDAAVFATTVAAAFSTRRKMLRRALGTAFGDDVAAAALAAAGIEGTKRAEELSVPEFGRIADQLFERRKGWSGTLISPQG